MTYPHNELDAAAEKPQGRRRDPETGEWLGANELTAADYRAWAANTLLPHYPKWDAYIFGALKGRWLEKRQRETTKREMTRRPKKSDEGSFFGGSTNG